MRQLPETGYLRLKQILGDKKLNIPALIPVCRATWWRGVKDGRYPAGLLISSRTRAWRVEDIRALIANPSTGESR